MDIVINYRYYLSAYNLLYFYNFMYLEAPIDLYNSQNAMRRVTWGYICTLKIKLYIKANNWKVIIFTVMSDTF